MVTAALGMTLEESSRAVDKRKRHDTHVSIFHGVGSRYMWGSSFVRCIIFKMCVMHDGCVITGHAHGSQCDVLMWGVRVSFKERLCRASSGIERRDRDACAKAIAVLARGKVGCQ